MNLPLTQLHLLSIAKFRLLQYGVFLVGLTAMGVAGWYLIEGMLHFAGDNASKRVFIAAGIIFQVTESICFIAAAALSSKSWHWRLGLILLGSTLFLFSITVMTLAQKATLQAGDMEASALNNQIKALEAQVESLTQMIGSYRLNAEKQSQSVYANSRELGQDSLNRATELENKKLALSEKLFELNSAKRQTSSDFFTQLEKVVGFPALQMEFYFLVSRSLLLELCGIVLMAFAAHLKLPAAPKTQPNSSKHDFAPVKKDPPKTKPILEPVARPPAPTLVGNDGHWASSHIQILKQKSTPDE